MKTRRTDACLVLCGVLVWFLADAERLRAAAAKALALCGKTVVPALFPFLAVSGMLVSLGFGEWLAPRFAGLMGPLFRLPGSAATALLLGLVGGYPIGARTAADLYRTGALTREEAERLLAFCNNSNPVFLVSVLGGIFGSPRAGIWLWLIHILSALLTGLLFRGRKPAKRQTSTRNSPCHPVPLTSAFVGAVKGAGSAMVSICAFVVFFYVLVSPLTTLGGRLGAALVGTMELFSLTPLLTASRFGFVLAAFAAGWGGLSVLCQTAAVLEDSGLSARNCLLGKAVQGALSALLALLLSGYVLG